MRGALAVHAIHPRLDRIIPAYAGSTNYGSFMYSDTEDHPRVCWEHAWRPLGWEPVAGSSPRMRGAPSGWQKMRSYGRIIPAYAGSTVLRTEVSSEF